MDAYGNLTNIDEFLVNRQIRLVSYLDPDCALGLQFDGEGGASAVVSRISTDSPGNSIFIAIDATEEGGAGNFVLEWAGQYQGQGSYYLCSDDAHQQLYTNALPVLGPGLTQPNQFLLNFVDGCWFNLELGSNLVVDVSESDTSQGNAIVSWESNGGQNQMWRAATMGPGLAPSAAAAVMPTPAPAATIAGAEPKAGKITTYAEFWPFYLREHGKPLTRAIHYVGTFLSLWFLLIAVGAGGWWWAAVPLSGYAFAWAAHFAVEKNRPATFTYPFWSLISDYRMFFLWFGGRLDRHLKAAGVPA